MFVLDREKLAVSHWQAKPKEKMWTLLKGVLEPFQGQNTRQKIPHTERFIWSSPERPDAHWTVGDL